MEDQIEQPVDVQTIETEVETPAATPTETTQTPPEAGSATGEVDADEWKPNFKVKAYDSEYEIPENFRSFINKTNEADFRKIFEKAYGLDVMSGKNAKLRETNTSFEKMIKEKYEPLDQGVKRVSKFLERDDFDSFFDALKIPEEKLQKWMLQKLQMKDLPPDQQAIYNQHSEAQKRAYKLEQEAEAYKGYYEQTQAEQQERLVQERSNELQQVLNRPEIKAIVEKFDTRKNQPGAFREEVVQRAQYLVQTKKQDISAEEAVKDFMGLLMIDSSQPQAGASPSGGLAPKAPSQNPTLPNIAGKIASPAAQKVKTLDDLYKIKKSMGPPRA